MSDQEKPLVVADGVIVSLDYTLTVEGEVVDSTKEEEPIEFMKGYNAIIPGLERELEGMSVGETKSVTVAAQDAYGEFDPRQMVEVPRSEFPEGIPVEEGVELQVRDQQGNLLNAVISKVEGEKAVLDFNHPLAGKELHFDVKIAGLRAATDEELAHGHAHGPEGH